MSDNGDVIKIEPTFDQAGNANYQLISTEKGCNVEQQCVVYPEHVIPVVFVPGVMGSNLKNKSKPQNKIWRLDSIGGVFADWFNVDAATRKLKLNPDNTVVDDNGVIDSKDEPFLLKNRRERGWGSVGYTSYASFLDWLQNSLNDFNEYQRGERYRLLESVMETETGDVTLSTDEVDLSYRYIYPVFAVGYNWLRSNADSAEYLGEKIDGIIKFYQTKGRKCEKVILITHSMGGLVARHYTQNLGGEKKVLGVVHGVMPALGAAATYRRMKAGTENPGGAEGWVAAQVLGGDAKMMTAVLSQSPGPLQLLPGREYGRHWLKIIDGENTYAYPQADPFEEIYLQRDKWWGLCDKQFINPERSHTQQEWDSDWESFSKIIEKKVMKFIDGVSGKYHPNTYAFYSADSAFASYGEVCWQAKTPRLDGWLNRHRSRDARQGRVVDNTERFDKRTISSPLSGSGWTKGIQQTYQILPAAEAGDGTVPARSGRIAGHLVQARYQVSVGHEPAYQSPLAQQFTLRALVKIMQQTDLR
ncbi:hypothetical protein OSR40_012445 [Serratia rubidaea]|uniref:PGAP1-like alpha/beta domain-containing protein n=1 Tax=Serratia rubidaea TaxID=61652 RepID=UPI0023AF513A|nr:hypothetical protein [Serratia rubidaea]MDK1704545.1 hypothetical protein [Serratia rubidaea]